MFATLRDHYKWIKFFHSYCLNVTQKSRHRTNTGYSERITLKHSFNHMLLPLLIAVTIGALAGFAAVAFRWLIGWEQSFYGRPELIFSISIVARPGG